MSPSSLEKRILLVGGGHAHVQVLAAWRRLEIQGLKLTLVTNEAELPYSGMVPGHLLGLYRREEIFLNLRDLCRTAGAEFVSGTATRVDTERRRVYLADGTDLEFDIASFNLGGHSDALADGERVVHVRPLPRLIEQWAELLGRLKSWSGPMPPRVAIIGGGSSGVELSLALAAQTRMFQARPVLTIWQTLVPMHSHGRVVRRLALQELSSAGVRLRTGIEVHSWVKGRLEFESVSSDRATSGSRGQGTKGSEEADFVLLATPVKPDPMFRTSGLPVDADGFLMVTETLQVTGHSHLFGAGDCIHFPKPIPRSGVYAVRQGQWLAGNLVSAATGTGPIRPYVPQPRALALITLGGPRALASYGALGFSGRAMWRLKDAIDRRFMGRFRK